MRRFLLLMLVVMLAFGAFGLMANSNPAQALAPFSLDIANIDFTGDCITTFGYSIDLTFVNPKAEVGGGDYVGIVVYDALGNPIDDVNIIVGVIDPDSFTATQPNAALADALDNLPLTVKAFDTDGSEVAIADFEAKPLLASVTVSPGVCGGSGTDARLNPGHGDLEIVLFPAVDDDGNTALHVYALDDDGNAFLAFVVTEDAVTPLVTDPPAQNTLIAEGDGFAFYVLTTGELQCNIGPNDEGKTFVVVFDWYTMQVTNYYVIE